MSLINTMKKCAAVSLFFVSTALFAQSIDVAVDFPSKDWVEPFPVTIKLVKGKLNSFGKVQLSFDPAYKVSVIDRAGATFTCHEGQAKFLWMTMPAQETIELVMLVSTNGKRDVGVSGAFYYMDAKDEPRHETIPLRSYTTSGGEAMAQSSPLAKTEEKQTKKEKREEKKEEKHEAVAENQAAIAAQQAESTVSSSPKPVGTDVTNQLTQPVAAAKKPQPQPQIPQPEPEPSKAEVRPTYTPSSGGVVFRAQVSAQKTYEAPAMVGQKKGISAQLNYDNHEDWHKYTTGEFSNYRAAKTYANELRETNQVSGSFVVGFESGQRITIQRAIELAK